MRKARTHRVVRADQIGSTSSLELLPALLVMLIAVGAVLAVVHHAAGDARSEAANERARLQADILIRALEEDPALCEEPGKVVWERAEAVGRGESNLSFVPPTARIVTLIDTRNGREITLFNASSGLSPSWVFADLPVPIELPDGSLAPGILRAGVGVG